MMLGLSSLQWQETLKVSVEIGTIKCCTMTYQFDIFMRSYYLIATVVLSLKLIMLLTFTNYIVFSKHKR